VVPAVTDRWATFDCYGTLVDWNAGIGAELERLWGRDERPRLVARYHELEPEIEAEDPARPYRDVLALSLERLAQAEALAVPSEEADALARSLPGWPVFPEVPAALDEARRRGWKLAILSNTDREFIEASMKAIGVPFELAIVASEIGSYKPGHRHWEEFFAQTGAERERHAHVAASHFHDVVPAHELGLGSVWINRLGEPGEPKPTRELSDLVRLPNVLDELVPE
jgi:2-haloacid dehalogenase